MPDELYLDQLADVANRLVAPRTYRDTMDYDWYETTEQEVFG